MKSPEEPATIALTRKWLTDVSTLGTIEFRDFACYSLELRTRRDNVQIVGNTSIPEGTYSITLVESPHFGMLLPLLHDVPGRSDIEIHPGNRVSDIRGCICPGLDKSDDCVWASRAAFDRLMDLLRSCKGNLSIAVTSDIKSDTREA